LLIFSHGYSAHRRQSTHFCTHVASHGYVVAAPDHVGNTVIDVVLRELAEGRRGRAEALAGVEQSIADRPRDVALVIDRVADFVQVDRARIGLAGHSFGGWTCLASAGALAAVRAVVAFAPSGGRAPTYPGRNPMAEALDLAWGRDIATLVLAAERDTLLPLEGVRELFARIRDPKRMIVLEAADHLHFLDNIEMMHEAFRTMPAPALFGDRNRLVPPLAELCAPAHAYAFVRGAGLAHLDAHVARREEARRYLEHELSDALRTRGIRALF
jgi:predicted dienelactone hydrolase